MTRKLKQRRSLPVDAIPVDPSKKTPAWILPFSLGGALVALCFVAALPGREPGIDSLKPLIAPKSVNGPMLGNLALMSRELLDKQDLTLMNLRCAEGLPGAEKLSVSECLATLNKWTYRVRQETERHLYKFREHPEEYENSEAYFRMLMLITVLQQDFKVHYNPERITDVDFTKPEDLFIHGLLQSDTGGTCVSMPVLYTAVARRLGYPVYLVTAKEHVFCRWDGQGERFNIEATNQGMNTFSDEYYLKWPKSISQAEFKNGYYLKSLSNTESLAVFLAARGHCQQDNGLLAQARVSYAMAAEKSPKNPIYANFLAKTVIPRQRAQTFAAMPPRYSPHSHPNQVQAYRPDYTAPAPIDPHTYSPQGNINPHPPGFTQPNFGTGVAPQYNHFQPSPLPAPTNGHQP